MSFLAKLRQNADTTPALQLQYHVEVCGSAWLRMTVQPPGQPERGFGQPYVIRNGHLKNPPEFLSPADLPLLADLLRANEQLNRCATTRQLPQPCGEWLARAAATGRLFFESRGRRPEAVALAVLEADRWFWQVDGAGRQRLCAQLPKGMIEGRFANAYTWFDPVARRALLLPDGRYHALRPLLEQTLDAGVGTPEFEALARQCAQLRLPAPHRLAEAPVAAGDTLVLRACSGHKAGRRGHWLELQLRFASERVAWTVPLAQVAAYKVFDGERLLLSELPETLTARLTALDKVLQVHGIHRDEAVWFLDGEPQWQALLVEGASALTALDVVLTADAGFDFPLRPISAVTLEVVRQAGELQLTLLAEVDGEWVELNELLGTWLEAQFSAEHLRLVTHEGVFLLPRATASLLQEELGDWLAQGLPRLPQSQAYRFGRLLGEQALSLRGDDLDLERCARLWQQPKPAAVDRSVVLAQLRPYQWLGVQWLLHVHQCGLNGLLADDMGLGKTLQTIAFFSTLHRQGNLSGAVLILAPASLLQNWQNEFERFSQHLRAQLVHGQQRRIGGVAADDMPAVFVTSYATFVRDLAQWQAAPPTWLVLDEAQAIKNPATRLRQAVCAIPSPHRLCLTGTPLENHLGELWSLMDFLNPGMLGSQRGFRDYYQKPVEDWGKGERLEQLLERISPCVLRRTKQAVAADLPEKTEIVQSLPLANEQLALYRRIKAEQWQQLATDLAGEDNSGRQQMLVLSALLKLRQACCDPALLAEAEVPSAKTEHCLEMLAELVSEGSAVLVFSQFTQMLDILADRLTGLKIPWLKLTGASRNRQALVERFQRGEAPVFLISLKAGGTGLNLTRADTVIHFDPWWNRAAEAQASDRAHRIGQHRPVFVYKLIAQDTVEEKIAQLQGIKANLGESINRRAEYAGEQFAINLKTLLALWRDEK